MQSRLLKFVILFFLVFSIDISAQDIRGQVLDAGNGEPIPFAIIKITNTNNGFTADENGFFLVPNTLESGTQLTFLSLGYEDKIVTLDDFKLSELNTVNLSQKIEVLDQIVLSNKRAYDINTLSARDIIDKALEAIPRNLSSNPFSQIGYYRDYQIDAKDGGIYNLNEGIFEQYDQGIKSDFLVNDNNQTVAYSFSQNKNYVINDILASSYGSNGKKIERAQIRSYGGNEFSILNTHNAIRRYDQYSFSFVYQMNEDLVKMHDFKKIKAFKEKGDYLITIGVTLRNTEPAAYDYDVKGELIISLEDFSIFSFRYKVFEKREEIPLFKLFIEYEHIDNNMYLKYISFHNRFKVLDPNFLREEKVLYNQKDKKLVVIFNKPVDFERLRKRFFKVKYRGRKIKVKEILKRDSKTIELVIAPFATSEGVANNLEVSFSKIKDLNGNKIYDQKQKSFFQLREFFIQDTFINKLWSPDIESINKYAPLIEAPVIENKEARDYLISQPLMRNIINQ